MNAKVKDKVFEILRSEANRRKISDALSSAVADGGSKTVVVKDVKDQDVTLHLQRRPALSR